MLKMDNNSLEAYFEADGRPPQPRRESIDLIKFKDELAFHEASHFVIGRLVNKRNIGFKEATSITIDSKTRSGVVRGFGYNFDQDNIYWSNRNIELFKSFYLEDERRIWAESLNLIAGYASFKLFISNQEDFISCIDEGDNTKVIMHTLDSVPHNFYYTNANKHTTGISDFAKIKERLSFIGIVSTDKRVEAYKLLLRVASEIMSVRAVELAIRFVKNKLKASDGEVIEDGPFEEMKGFVDNLISKVTITYWLGILLNRNVEHPENI